MTELFPEACAVHGGRLIVGRVDGLEAGKHSKGHKGNGDNNADGALPDKLNLIGGTPVHRILQKTQIQQDVVQVAVFHFDDVVPYGSLNDQGSSPGEDHDRPGDLSAAERLIEHHGTDKADEGGKSYNGNHPDGGVKHHLGKSGRRNSVLKVFQSDKPTDNPGTADVAEGQAEDNADGENNENQHQQDAGKNPEIGLPTMTDKN